MTNLIDTSTSQTHARQAAAIAKPASVGAKAITDGLHADHIRPLVRKRNNFAFTKGEKARAGIAMAIVEPIFALTFRIMSKLFKR